ncbi:MAG: TolC family protein [Chitinophagales bacterium]|nr:TolC family protein [Chitinophagales bacterium]
MNKLIVLLVTSFILPGLYAQQSVFTVEAAIDYALKHNYNHQKNQLEKSITYEKTQEVLTQGFPKINGSIAYQNQFIVPTSVIPGDAFGAPGQLIPVQFGISNTMNANIGLQQLIFDGRYLVGVQARASIKELANLQVKMSERDVKVLISKNYFQAVAAKKSLKSLKESKLVIEKLYDQTNKIYKQGLIEELDVERLQYNVKTIENAISVLETQNQLAISALKLNMGFPMEDSLMIAEDVAHILQEAFQQSPFIENLENRLEFKLADQAILLKKYDLKQMRYSALPSLFGAANYGYNSFSNRFNFLNNKWYNFGNFGIQANIPIFDGFTRKSQISQAKLALEKAEVDKQNLYNSLKIENMNTVLTLRNNINEFKNQKDILKLSEKIEHKTQVKYKEGVGSSFEFANAQNERIQQYLKLLQSELNLLNSHIDLKKIQGKF